ncbi:tetratricopeptide repeat protein [Occultella gossypii]|uniref:Tetratricopeptide repeat protein n=1 Tax=Occultella gossypii TaxID=2800820 RepID=A0ABS7SED8_9MICO|nr:tetratricopeptide repeat protein [Occultella gossypii]MBZ2197633.1 tetratricopeptide repeat protein [Occultella gossypii]
MARNIDALWDFEDPTGSADRFRAAIVRADGAERDVLTTQLARALGMAGRYDEAERLLESLDAATNAVDRGPEVVVRVALERGRLRRSAGRPDPEPLRTAADLAEAAGLEALRIDALHMLALIAETPEAQVAANREALGIARTATDPRARRWEASLLNNLGCALVDAGDPGTALEVFRQAQQIRRDAGQAREEQIARWMVAWALRLLGRRTQALAMQRALKEDLIAAGIDDEDVDAEIALLTDPLRS